VEDIAVVEAAPRTLLLASNGDPERH
jgi:hypothetical protein